MCLLYNDKDPVEPIYENKEAYKDQHWDAQFGLCILTNITVGQYKHFITDYQHNDLV